MNKRISVVVCILNEEERLEECLISIVKNKPDEIIIVDGGSSDKSLEIAEKYTVNIIQSEQSNLTRDRQKGLDAARNEYIALIDADHRLQEGDLANLLKDLESYNFDIIQGQLKSYKKHNWLNRAEEAMWELNHNIPGPKKMIGVAPAIYKKEVFEKVNFDDNITKTIDDTDFIYRVSMVPSLTYGIGNTKIAQLHDSSLQSYRKKFQWYGKGDGEFCIKHPGRMPSMIYHIGVRYPLIYSIKGIISLKYEIVPFVILQGYTRLFWALKTIIKLKRS